MTGLPARSPSDRYWSGVTRSLKPGAVVPATRRAMLSPPTVLAVPQLRNLGGDRLGGLDVCQIAPAALVGLGHVLKGGIAGRLRPSERSAASHEGKAPAINPTSYRNQVMASQPHPLKSLDALAALMSCHRGQEICGESRPAEHWYCNISGAARRRGALEEGDSERSLTPSASVHYFPSGRRCGALPAARLATTARRIASAS